MRNLVIPITKGNQPFMAVLFSLITIWVINILFTITSWNDLILLGLFMIISLGSLYVVKYVVRLNVPLPIFLLYLLIASFFIGPGFISLNVGPIGIFPYRILLAIMVLLFLLELVQRKYILDARSIHVLPAICFFLFWIGYALISLTWVKSLPYGIRDFVFLFSGIITVIFVVYYFYKEKDYMAFFYIWLGAVVLFILLGLWNHLTHQHLPISRLATAPDYIKGRPSAVFTNENDFASYMAISLFFGFALFNHAKKRLSKYLGLTIVILSTYLILVSTSRASIIAVLLGFTFWFLFLTKAKQKLQVIFLGILAAVAGSVLFYERVMTLLSGVWSEISSVLGRPSVEEGSVDIRKNLILNGVEFLKDTYGLGIGAGNAEYYIKNLSQYPTFGQTNVHNWWVEIGTNYGIVILTCYILVYFGLIVKLYKIHRSTASKKVKMISEALLLGFIVFSIASVSPSSIMTLSYTWLLFAFGLGFINLMYLKKKGAFEQYE